MLWCTEEMYRSMLQRGENGQRAGRSDPRGRLRFQVEAELFLPRTSSRTNKVSRRLFRHPDQLTGNRGTHPCELLHAENSLPVSRDP